MSKLTMSWPDRFALIDHYRPTDAQVCATFGLTQDDLDTARNLQLAGIFRPSTNLDVGRYATIFTSPPALQEPTVTKKNATSFEKPETASKRVKVPQKRGRKGDKIQQALLAVPTSPVPVSTFSAEYGVSLAVLRQAKRFMQGMSQQHISQIGKINVRQDKATKALMIWRE